jgi:hypothetical protein
LVFTQLSLYFLCINKYGAELLSILYAHYRQRIVLNTHTGKMGAGQRLIAGRDDSDFLIPADHRTGQMHLQQARGINRNGQGFDQLSLKQGQKAATGGDGFDTPGHQGMAGINEFLDQPGIQLKMLQELFDLLLLKYSRNLVLLGIMDSSQQEHFQILEDVQNENASKLEKAITDHLQNVKEHISEGLKRMFVSKRETVADLYSFQ